MADHDDQRDLKRRPLRERSRQWFITIGTALALLATLIGFLSDSVGVLEFLQGRMGATPVVDVTATVPEETGGVPKEVTVSPPNAATPPTDIAPTSPASSVTPIITPAATPFPVMAAVDERLLIVAQFTNFAVDANFNVAGRIQEALAEQVAAAGLADTRVAVWPEVVSDAAHAESVRQGAGAAMVIWGEYDSGRVRVRFALDVGGTEVEWQRLLNAPTELSTTINLEVPRETQALALMVLGRLYRNAGDMVRARAAFAQALDQRPGDQDTVATLTFYLAALDAAATPPAVDRAIEGYTQVIEMRPAWLNAHYNRGLAYLMRYWMTAESDNLDSAIADFTWTLDAKHNYVEAFINRAIALYARNGEGDLAASVADLDAAIGTSPSSARAYYNRGLAYIRLDQRAQWEADLNKSLQLAPDFWVAHHALCWGYALDQLPDAGLVHCDAAMEKDASGSSLDGRGLILTELGQLDEAEIDLTKYLAWLDTQPEAWSTLNNRTVYEEIVAGLQLGENRVNADVLAKLR